MPRKKKTTKKGRVAPADQNAAITAGLLQALRHPIRVQILELLAQRPGSSTTISETLNLELGTVSYHLNKVLHREAHVVKVVNRRRVRGAVELFYEIDRQAIIEGFQWPRINKPFADGIQASGLLSFQKIAVAALEAEAPETRRDRTLAWRPAPLDAVGWEEVRTAVTETEQRFDLAIERSAARLAKSGSGGPIHTIMGIAVFEAAPLLQEEER